MKAQAEINELVKSLNDNSTDNAICVSYRCDENIFLVFVAGAAGLAGEVYFIVLPLKGYREA